MVQDMNFTFYQAQCVSAALGLREVFVPELSDQYLDRVPDNATKSSWGGYDPRWSPPVGGKQGEYTKERSAKAVATRKKNGTIGGWFYKSGHSDETKKTLSAIAKERGAYATGRNPNNEIVECPHCGKQGAKPGLKRWHFDNCKSKA